jgi:hypothetical protein
MRKRVRDHRDGSSSQGSLGTIGIPDIAEIEVTSEHPDHPIEAVFAPESRTGWQAANSGEQTIRIVFERPTRLQRIGLEFQDPSTERTQEYVLRWAGNEGPLKDIVRQQWNFSPQGSTVEVEEHRVDLQAATVLEMVIRPDIRGGDARASLYRLTLA